MVFLFICLDHFRVNFAAFSHGICMLSEVIMCKAWTTIFFNNWVGDKNRKDYKEKLIHSFYAWAAWFSIHLTIKDVDNRRI